MPEVRADGSFPETRWSRVLRARGEMPGGEGVGAGVASSVADQALSELCRAYWQPLYVYARRCGRSAEDAEDLTQGFFARLIHDELLAKADPARGRLRSFLLGSFKRFMSEDWRGRQCQKRGGGQVVVSFDSDEAETLFRGLSSAEGTPDALFDRVWLGRLLDAALAELEREHVARGKERMFRRLQEYLAWDRGGEGLSAVAADLGLSPGAVRVTIHRMRQRFRHLLERQVAETVMSPAEAAEELQRLLEVASG